MPTTQRSAVRSGWCASRPLLILVMLSVPVIAGAIPLRTGTATFTATQPRDTLFTLPVTWVVLDSVQVLRNGQHVSEFADWRLAEPGNRIWIYRPLGPSDTLRVTFVYEPIPLYRSYIRHSLRDIERDVNPHNPGDTSRIVPAFAPQSAALEGWSRLVKSGSLIRSVQVGTGQDLQLESALNLQVQGRVGRNVDVVAALTDQSTPIQPEGTTETLNELEKIFVAVKTPHFSTTLGDYNLDLSGGQYDSYQRKLTGVLGQASYAGITATGGGAVSRGQYFTNSFEGQEANQGPYPLHGKKNEIGLVVLAGTEKVWLDGQLLRRGEGNDYTIDYSSGEITFTSRHVITSDSRVVVDFEYSSEDYQRFYGAGRVEGATADDRYGGSFTFINESDDRTQPIGFTLSQADRDRLARAGSNPDSAVVFAADTTDSPREYVVADTTFDTTRVSIFIYAPRDSLHQLWHVIFDDFGLGNGDYEATADTLGHTYFYWVGPRRGRYRSYRRLPLPEQHSVADVRAHGSPIDGLTLKGEMAMSQLDRNTFSDGSGATTNGAAFTGGAAFDRQNLSLGFVTPYSIGADLQIRHRDERFSELSRASEIEFQRDWDVAVNDGIAETIREANVHLSPVQALSFTGGYGDLARGQLSSSVRRTIGMSANLWKWNLSATHLALQSDDSLSGRRGDWIRQSARLGGLLSGGPLLKFSPRFGADRENKKDRVDSLSSGYRFYEYFGGMGVALPHDLSLDGEYRDRTDDNLDLGGVFHRAAHAYTISTETAWNPSESGRTLLRYVHREKSYATLDSANVSTDVGRLETLLTTRNRVLEANAVYEIAKTRSQDQVLIAVQVPSGTGNYRLENGSYVPDDQGDYLLVPRNTGDFQPATDLNLNSLISLRPDELPASETAPWIHALSTETEVVIEEKTRRNLDAQMLLLDQSQFRGDSTLSGNLSFRQDVNVWRLSQKLSLRLRYHETQSLENQYLNGGQGHTLHEGSARVRARYMGNWRGETETTISRESFTYGSGIFPSRDIPRFDFSQINTVSLSQKWEAGADLSVTEANDERNATQISLRELKPHVALTLLGKGRLDADFTWVHASSNKAVIPFELGRGSNRGENLRWELRGTYQFGQNFSGSVNYSARRDAGEPVFHTGRMEVRATF
jgi:hypothetical protein